MVTTINYDDDARRAGRSDHDSTRPRPDFAFDGFWIQPGAEEELHTGGPVLWNAPPPGEGRSSGTRAASAVSKVGQVATTLEDLL